MLFAGYYNNTWDKEYKFTAINPITDDYDIWGNVLMGRSGYLQQKLTVYH